MQSLRVGKKLTLLDAVLLRSLVVLGLLGRGDTLDTLVKVVLEWRTLLGLGALCS